MKFVCLNCETYMNFEKVEKPGEDTLGVFFGCPSCNAKFSMVTNPGETQMVSSLGVKLGGRTVVAEPFEMTRGTLKDEATTGAGQMTAYVNEKVQGGQPAAAVTAVTTARSGEKSSSGCPFSAMVAEMGLTSGGRPGNDGAATARGEGINESIGFNIDCHHRRERISAPGFTAGTIIPGSAHTNGQRSNKSRRRNASRSVRQNRRVHLLCVHG